MQAFPAGSQNNAMGGSGPINKEMNFDRYHGRGEEGWSDFNMASRVRRQPPPPPPPQPQQQPAAPVQRREASESDRATQYRHHAGHSDSNASGFNSYQKMELLHGDETAGLGTSTFLEGAPVPRSAMQRRESDEEATGMNGPGLTRKKSLAQKLRGISRPRQYGPDGRVLSPDGYTSPQSPEYVGVQSAGGRGRMNVERNPFFADAITEEKATVAP